MAPGEKQFFPRALSPVSAQCDAGSMCRLAIHTGTHSLMLPSTTVIPPGSADATDYYS